MAPELRLTIPRTVAYGTAWVGVGGWHQDVLPYLDFPWAWSALLADIGLAVPPPDPADSRALNPRLPDAEVAANYLARFAAHAPEGVRDGLREAARSRLTIDPDTRALISRALFERYGEANARLAAAFPPTPLHRV